MQAHDVTSAQQFIKLDLLDGYIIDPKRMTLETEYQATKGVAKARNLPPNGAASNNSQSLAEQFAVVAAGANGRICTGDPPKQSNHKTNGQFAYRMDRITGPGYEG